MKAATVSSHGGGKQGSVPQQCLRADRFAQAETAAVDSLALYVRSQHDREEENQQRAGGGRDIPKFIARQQQESDGSSNQGSVRATVRTAHSGSNWYASIAMAKIRYDSRSFVQAA